MRETESSGWLSIPVTSATYIIDDRHTPPGLAQSYSVVGFV